MKKLILRGLMLALLTPIAALLLVPAGAQASMPSGEDRVDAKTVARDFWAEEWGAYPDCYGVGLRWRSRSYMGRALAFVRNDGHHCTINFNKGVDWAWLPEFGRSDDWWRFCMTAIHEYGHLPGMPFDGRHGKPHSLNPNSIMAASETLTVGAWWYPYFPACEI
jgi:hypothetical protein